MNRIHALAFAALCSFVILVPPSPAQPAGPPRPNVLVIIADDLNHWVGYTGRNPQTQTPNIDRLSKKGVSFTNAHCPAPLCCPSRAAFLGGQRPTSTGCYSNGDNWKEFVPEGRGLPAAFKHAGYFVAGAGKVYHKNAYYKSEWDAYLDDSDLDDGGKGVGKLEGLREPVKHDLTDQSLSDWHIADFCIEQINTPRDRPFFIACGLHKPHLPLVVPRKYYDLFPLDTIKLPPVAEDDLGDVPPAGIKMARPDGDHKAILAAGRWKLAVQAYLACIAYTDMNVGRVLDALGKSPQANNTIIVFLGDHGWHLGEKQHWRKFTLWEESTRSPLIWVVPGLTPENATCARAVDFMSIYPTLCELTGVTPAGRLDSASIKPLLADPAAPWSAPAICTFGQGNHSICLDQWRLIRYADGKSELYDRASDPYEWTNLAPDPAHAQMLAQLAAHVPREEKKGSKSRGSEDE